MKLIVPQTETTGISKTGYIKCLHGCFENYFTLQGKQTFPFHIEVSNKKTLGKCVLTSKGVSRPSLILVGSTQAVLVSATMSISISQDVIKL